MVRHLTTECLHTFLFSPTMEIPHKFLFIGIKFEVAKQVRDRGSQRHGGGQNRAGGGGRRPRPMGGWRAIIGTQARRAGEQKGVRRINLKINFLESLLYREGNECAYLVRISRPMLFNSAKLICSHGSECLEVRADLMHLVWCSTLLHHLWLSKLKTGSSSFGGRKKLYRTDRDLSIVRQRQLMKAFAAIKFKQKWMMPLCFPNHLASEWYLTLNAQIDLWLSNWLVNVSHLNFPHFLSAKRARPRY